MERAGLAIEDLAALPSGMLWAFDFVSGKAAARAATPDWRWAHLGLGDVRAPYLLRESFDLPAPALELFSGREDRILLDTDDGWVFGVLPDLERDFGGAPQGEGRLTFAYDGQQLVTGRLHPLKAVDDLRRLAERGESFETPAAAVARLVEIYLEHLGRLLDRASDELARIEDYVLNEPRDPRHPALSGARRALVRWRRELQGLRGALTRALGGRQGERIASLTDWLPDLISWCDDVDREAGGLQDRARLLHEEIDTQINGATNRSMRALAIISTLLIPPTLVVGAFGMNVPGIPFEHSQLGFSWGLAICIAVVVAAVMMLRRMDLLP